MSQRTKIALVVTCLLFTVGILPALIARSLAPRADFDTTDFVATDPGVRGGPAGVGGMLSGLNAHNQQLFLAGLASIQEIDSVQGTVPGTGLGLGPRFNMDSCGGCHGSPAPGGSSPAVNPQVAVA